MNHRNQDFYLLQEAYQSITEAEINVNRIGDKGINISQMSAVTGKTSVSREDLSNFIYKMTDGGREEFTVWTVRTNDSKTDPNKKAGAIMVVNGRYGPCRKDVKGVGSPLGSPQARYTRYNLITMCVSSIDGRDYTGKLPDESRTRHIKVDKITKIAIGGNVYNVK